MEDDTEKINIDDYQEEKANWYMEKDTITRVHHLGADAKAWRQFARQKPAGGTEHEVFNKYIHMTGRQIMQTQMLEDEKEDEEVKEDEQKRKKKADKILRKRIKASDMEDGLVDVLIDREWDTTGWTEQEIHAGCEFLVVIFEQNNDDASPEKKERALMMLDKLVFRHKEAKEYMRKNLDVIIGKAANRRLKGGQSASKLDIMNVIKSVAHFFHKELSSYNFIGRFSEMTLLEARLAATLIQHTFRTMRERNRSRHGVNPATQGFGSDDEMALLRARALNTRSAELRSKWRSMHWLLPGKKSPGIRGPAHVQGHFLHIALDIFQDLLSSTTAGPYAPSNRGDLVSSYGTILLVNFLSYGHDSGFAEKSVHIICCVSRLPDAFFNLAAQETVAACRMYAIKIRTAKESLTSELYINLLKTMQNMAEHAAGVYRGREGYDYYTPQSGDVEPIDFQHMCTHGPQRLTSKVIRGLLASQKTLCELKALVLEVTHLEVVRVVLRTLFALACSDCYEDVLVKVNEDGATLLIRMVDLLEEQDLEVATLSTCLLLQLATRKKGRDMMFGQSVHLLLRPIMTVPIKRTSRGEPATPNYRHMPYLRACAVALALSRQHEWQSYNPLKLPPLVSKHDDLKELMHMDAIMTIKDITPGDTYSYKRLAQMETDRDIAYRMSIATYRSDVKQLSDFFCHPDDHKHFYNMDWDKATCVLAILEALAGSHESAQDMFSSGTVRFAGQCLTLGKFEFLNPNKRLSEEQMIIVFMGVQAACNCISNLCDTAGHGEGRHPENAPIILLGSRDASLVGAAGFFVNTLGQKHPELTQEAKRVHEDTGFAALRQLDRFAAMLLSGDDQNIDMHDLMETGKCVSYVVRELRVLYGSGSRMVAYLDRLCKLVGLLATPSFGASAAINDWRIAISLREHLPAPLSGLSERALSKALSQARHLVENVDEKSQISVASSRRGRDVGSMGATKKFIGANIEDEGYLKYRRGLGTLTDTFFNALYQLCQLDQAKDFVITDGFLRRCLDKVHLLAPALEGERELSNWAALVRRGKETPESLERTEMASCLRLLSRCASYHSSKVGAVNDILMHKFYDTVHIVTKIARSVTCPRNDPCYLAAWGLIAKLSLDPARMAASFRDEDIVGMCRTMLKEVDVEAKQIPDECLDTMLDTLMGISTGFLGDDLLTQLPMMRLSLNRCSRLRPNFSKKIVDINFNISRQSSGAIGKDVRTFMATESRFAPGATLERETSTVNMSMADEQVTGDEAAEDAWNRILVENEEDDMAMEHSLQRQRVSQTLGSKSINSVMSDMMMQDTEGGTSTSFRRTNLVRTKNGEEIELHDTPGKGWAGYYSSCGVGTCGSLRFPGKPCVHCGFVTVTEEQARKEISKLPIAAAGDFRADVSKLSAREPALQRRMAELKMKHGYMDKRLAVTAPQNLSIGQLGSDGGLGEGVGEASDPLRKETSVYTHGTFSSLGEGSGFISAVSQSQGGAARRLEREMVGFGASDVVSNISPSQSMVSAGEMTTPSNYGRFPGASPPGSVGGSRHSNKYFDAEEDEKEALSLAQDKIDGESKMSSVKVIPTLVTEAPVPKKTLSLFSPVSKKGRKDKKITSGADRSPMSRGMLSPKTLSRIIDVEDLPELRATRPPPRPSRK